jgi:hypothetical protein
MKGVVILCVAVLTAVGVGIGVIAGTDGGLRPDGTVSGVLLRVGFPARVPVPVPGTVTVQVFSPGVSGSARTYEGSAGSNGHFAVPVPPGRYSVFARIPSSSSCVIGPCGDLVHLGHIVRVRAGTTAHVILSFSLS